MLCGAAANWQQIQRLSTWQDLSPRRLQCDARFISVNFASSLLLIRNNAATRPNRYLIPPSVQLIAAQEVAPGINGVFRMRNKSHKCNDLLQMRASLQLSAQPASKGDSPGEL